MERMEHDDQPTCGTGLAASASLPTKLAALMAALAEVLERHTHALDLTDAATKEEHDAYTKLARAHRVVAGELASLAEAMTHYRDLPMGQHDMTVMADPNGQAQAFQRFVALERELLSHLQAKVEEEEQMLR